MAKVSIKRHLRELQWRLMLVAAFFIAGACLAYYYQDTLVPLMLNPLHGERLVYLNPAGGFSFIFLISIYAGIALALPVLIQQLYAFLSPALPAKARRKSPIIIISSFFLLVAGIVFGYVIAVPNALTFLYSFADKYVEASLTADSYLNFMVAYTVGIGLVFQIPLLLMLLNTITPLKPGGLLKSEKWVVLVAFILAAIITPTPDPINQTIIAAPVIIVYQIGVIAILISYTRQKRQAKRLERKAVPVVHKIPVSQTTPPDLEATPLTNTIQQPALQATKVAPSVPKPVSMDGFIVQRPAPRLQVPQRYTTERATTPSQRQYIPQRRAFSIDGISRVAQ